MVELIEEKSYTGGDFFKDKESKRQNYTIQWTRRPNSFYSITEQSKIDMKGNWI